MAPHSSTLAWKIPWVEEPGAAVPGIAASQTRLSGFAFIFLAFKLLLPRWPRETKTENLVSNVHRILVSPGT